MRHLYLVFILFFISSNYAQKLKRYEISKDVSIDFPEKFELIDTLKQSITKGFIGNEVVMIIKPVQKDTIVTVENQEDLFKYYEGIKDGIVEKGGGKILKKENVKIKGFDILKLSYKLKVNGEEKIWESLSLFLNNYTYSIVFIRSIKTDTNFNVQKEKIISSLEFRKGLTAQNQLNNYDESSRAYKWGELIGSILVYVILGLVIYFAVRKRKPKHVT